MFLKNFLLVNSLVFKVSSKEITIAPGISNSFYRLSHSYEGFKRNVFFKVLFISSY